jgi:hypothetical protein
MKKSIALVALAFGVTSAFAQDLTSKKGEPILPEADDWSVGIDATPFLNYAGNFFGKTASNTAPGWNFFTSNQTITVKQMKDAQNAYRATFRLGFSNETQKAMVSDRSLTAPSPTATGYPTAPAMVENKWKHSETNIGISVGMEKRRGKTRLQGIYGAEVGIWIGSTKDKFTYGNALVQGLTPTGPGQAQDIDVDPDDEFAGFGLGSISSGANVQTVAMSGVIGDSRMTERKSGMTFAFGVRAFIGAEYFILPKMSLGGEFGWGLGYSMTGASKTTWESVGNTGSSTTNSIGTVEIKGDKSSAFWLDTDGNNTMFGPSAALKLNLYF